MFGRRKPEPQIWLFRSHEKGNWAKAILLAAPQMPFWQTLGPFRSEIDAEQTADHLNAQLCGEVLFYDPDNALDQNSEIWEEDESEAWKLGDSSDE